MKYYTDGYSFGGNPAQEGGYTICNELGEIVASEHFVGESLTNNEMELRGILAALRFCDNGDTISTDSMCCITWVKAGRSKARPDLKNLMYEAKSLLMQKRVNLMWEGRDFNLAGHYNEITYNA